MRCQPSTEFIPDWEKYPKAKAAKSADKAQQIIGWKTFLTPEGNLQNRTQITQRGSHSNANFNIIPIMIRYMVDLITQNQPCIPRQ